MGLAYFYYNRGKLRSAEKILRELGEQTRGNPEIIRSLIRLYIEPKKYAEAVILIEGMLKGAPDNSELHYMAGVAFEGIKDEKMTLKHLRQVRQDSRFYQNAAVHIAFLYQEKGETEKAISFLEEVIGKIPDNPDFHMYLGGFYEDAKNYEKAEASLQKGLELDTDNTRIWFRLGVIYDKWERKSDSIRVMQKVIELEPENSNALNYLGYTYADMGVKLDEAESLIRRALEQKPDDGYITDSLGWVFYKRGEYEEALVHMRRAVELVPDDPVILEHMGDVYLKLGQKEKALEFYKKSLSHQKEDKEKRIETEQKIRELGGAL